MKYAIFVTGSAGSGKSTTTNLLHEHFTVIRRRHFVFNFDPACEYLPYEPDIDIREMITNLEV